MADRHRSGDPASGGRLRVRTAAMGLPARSSKRRADHQLPLGGSAISEGTVPHTGVALLRVHRLEVAEVEMEVHQGGRRLVLLRRPVASDAGSASPAAPARPFVDCEWARGGTATPTSGWQPPCGTGPLAG